MLENANLVIRGRRVVLVPYKKEHVQKYHEWMQDGELQELTASEPLSLQEEYEMQRSWAQDKDKCTFILLDPDFPDTEGTGRHGGAMAGDVNIFLNDHEDPHTAEIEIMVAEPRSRRKGMAEEALTLFMAYASSQLGVTKFRAKIGEANSPSIQLMTKLGFAHVSRSEIFREVTLELAVEREAAAHLAAVAAQLHCSEYDAVGAGAAAEGGGSSAAAQRHQEQQQQQQEQQQQDAAR